MIFRSKAESQNGSVATQSAVILPTDATSQKEVIDTAKTTGEREANPGPIISAQNLYKMYRSGSVKIDVLKGVNFQVQPGEMVAIMGPSGCGKTTLLNCLAGLDVIDEGDIQIAGCSLAQLDDRQRTVYRAQNMGFIFQSFNLLPVLNAVENVELPLLMTGVRPGDARKRALKVLEMVGLSDRVRHRPSELSGGQQQRVTIARALVNKPAIIWADEPTGNLDSENAVFVMDMIDKLNRENCQTFVIVTHSPEISSRAERVIHMRDGMIVSDTFQTGVQSEQAQRVGDEKKENDGLDSSSKRQDDAISSIG